MTDINKNEAVVEIVEEKAITAEAVIASEPSKYTLEYALEQIEFMSKETKHIYEALDVLKGLESTGPGDIGTEEQSKAIANVVKCRETTNQQLIAFYEKMVDALKPKNAFDENRELLDWIQGCISSEEPGNARPMTEYAEFLKILKSMNN